MGRGRSTTHNYGSEPRTSYATEEPEVGTYGEIDFTKADDGAIDLHAGGPDASPTKKKLSGIPNCVYDRKLTFQTGVIHAPTPLKMPWSDRKSEIGHRRRKGRHGVNLKDMRDEGYWVYESKTIDKLLDKYGNDMLRALNQLRYEALRLSRNLKKKVMKRGRILPQDIAEYERQMSWIKLRGSAVKRTYEYLGDRMVSTDVMNKMDFNVNGKNVPVYGFIELRLAGGRKGINTYFKPSRKMLTKTSGKREVVNMITGEIETIFGGSIEAILVDPVYEYFEQIKSGKLSDPWMRGMALAHKYAVMELGEKIIERFKTRLRRGEGKEDTNHLFHKPAIATGELYESLRMEWDDTNNRLRIWSTSPHFAFVEYGNTIRAEAPSKEMLRAIYDWAVAKGILLIRQDVFEYYSSDLPKLADLMWEEQEPGPNFWKYVDKYAYGDRIQKEWDRITKKYDLTQDVPLDRPQGLFSKRSVKYEGYETYEERLYRKKKKNVKMRRKAMLETGLVSPWKLGGKEGAGYVRLSEKRKVTKEGVVRFPLRSGFATEMLFEQMFGTEKQTKLLYGMAMGIIEKYSGPMVYTERRFLDLAYMDVIEDQDLIDETFDKWYRRLHVFADKVPRVEYGTGKWNNVSYKLYKALQTIEINEERGDNEILLEVNRALEDIGFTE